MPTVIAINAAVIGGTFRIGSRLRGTSSSDVHIRGSFRLGSGGKLVENAKTVPKGRPAGKLPKPRPCGPAALALFCQKRARRAEVAQR